MRFRREEWPENIFGGGKAQTHDLALCFCACASTRKHSQERLFCLVLFRHCICAKVKLLDSRIHLEQSPFLLLARDRTQPFQVFPSIQHWPTARLTARHYSYPVGSKQLGSLHLYARLLWVCLSACLLS